MSLTVHFPTVSFCGAVTEKTKASSKYDPPPGERTRTGDQRFQVLSYICAHCASPEAANSVIEQMDSASARSVLAERESVTRTAT